MTDLTKWTLAELEAAIQSPTDGTWTRSAGMEAIRRIRDMVRADTAVGTFGWVLEGLRRGQNFRRTGWNGKGMFLILVPGSAGLTVDSGRPMAQAGVPIGTTFNYLPHIDLWTAQGELTPWTPSQADLLATDWETV